MHRTPALLYRLPASCDQAVFFVLQIIPFVILILPALPSSVHTALKLHCYPLPIRVCPVTSVILLPPDLIVLAGFLVVIPEAMIEEYENRIINIHPSLIPSFCGTGYYGLKVHEAALARGVKLTGATVHYVDKGTDTGPILLQKAVEVKPGDTPEILQRRVMEEAEWKLLPAAINMIANGEA